MNTLVPLWVVLLNMIMTSLLVGFAFTKLEKEDLPITPTLFFGFTILVPLAVFLGAVVVWYK